MTCQQSELKHSSNPSKKTNKQTKTQGSLWEAMGLCVDSMSQVKHEFCD